MISTGSDRAADSGAPAPTPAAPPKKSLRVRWNRRVAVFSVVLAVGAVASVATTQRLVGGFRDAAQRLEADATRSAQLRDQMAEHVNLGHSVIEREDDDGERRLAALEASIRADLARAAGSAHNSTERRLLRQARTRWDQGVAQIESYERSAPVEARTEAHLLLAEASAEAARLIDEAATAGRAAERAELARAERFATSAIAAMATMAALVVASMLRLGRRLGVEVLRPVARLRDSADRLGAGDLDHRAVVDRDDELGELAARFNAMADAIARTHCVLTHQANHDSLTGLANRAAFRACLDEALSRPQRRAGTQAVVLIDLDDFKNLNDTLGHAAGDELLAVVGARLAGVVRPGDVAARLGGDEFAVLVDGLADATAAHTVAERAVAAIAGPAEVAGATVQIAASAGVTLRGEIADPEELMRQADVAMYLAKSRGKNRVERYDGAVDAAIAERIQLRTDIGAAARRGELLVGYQPIVDLASGTVIAVEALVRWQHPTRGRLAPSEFVALAEETGAIVAIGAWVLDTAAAQLRRWQDDHGRPGLAVSVNVSARQLVTPGFADQVGDILQCVRVNPSCLILEITESAVVDASGDALATLAALRRLGVRIALDDFGTGFSSLGSLRQLPVDILKVDRSLVSGSPTDERGDALVEAIIALGQRLDLEVIPEGIETRDQLARLRDLGCRSGQGFLLSHPVPPAAVDALLAAATSVPPDGADDSPEPAASSTAA